MTTTQELDKILETIKVPLRGGWLKPTKEELEPVKAALLTWHQKQIATQRSRITAEVEKAYGGCHNCYGKGYATVNDRWMGHDTDQDIGSPGGTIQGGSDFAMKFCTCDRGKQLQELFTAEIVEARIDEIERVENMRHDFDMHERNQKRLAELKRLATLRQKTEKGEV
jgi:hypothetical protein